MTLDPALQARFAEPPSRRGTHSVKWDVADEYFGVSEMLPLFIADMDLPGPSSVSEALAERVAHGIFGYSVAPPDTKDLIVRWYRDAHGWEIEPDWVMTFPFSAKVAIGLAVSELAGRGGRVLLQPPVYSAFFKVVERAGARVVESPLEFDEGRYAFDAVELARVVRREQPSTFLFCSPHNPVGRVWSKGELSEISMLVVEYDLTLISDEVHCDLVYAGSRHMPAASLDDDLARRTIVVHSVTKTFNLAGIPSSFAVVPNPALRRRLAAARRRLNFYPNDLFGTLAQNAALAGGHHWLENVIAYLDQNRRIALKHIDRTAAGIRATTPEATYLLWLDFRQLGLDHAELRKRLLKQGLGLHDGLEFSEAGRGFQRLNFACGRRTLSAALDLLSSLFR